MVDVFKYQVNSFLFSKYLNKVYEVWMFQHLQHHIRNSQYITTI